MVKECFICANNLLTLVKIHTYVKGLARASQLAIKFNCDLV